VGPILPVLVCGNLTVEVYGTPFGQMFFSLDFQLESSLFETLSSLFFKTHLLLLLRPLLFGNLLRPQLWILFLFMKCAWLLLANYFVNFLVQDIKFILLRVIKRKAINCIIDINITCCSYCNSSHVRFDCNWIKTITHHICNSLDWQHLQTFVNLCQAKKSNFIQERQ